MSKEKMNEINNLLKQSVALEKKAYSEYVKTATSESIKSLVTAGLPFEKAASLVAAEFEVSEDIRDKVSTISMMDKVAEYVDFLESKVQNLETTSKEQAIKEPMTKLASFGLEEEELKTLSGLDSKLLEKIAAASGPLEMGHRVGPSLNRTDPLISWILGTA
jgi:predicted RNase H-like nuclease (RuvC/YqgF family)